MNRKKLSVIFFVGFAIISGCGKSVSEIKDSNLVENDTLEGDITFSTEETSGDSNEVLCRCQQMNCWTDL
ncbi:hypothetical protein DWX81_00650 [Roseburia inulinivorans]|uniref:hypothetical protein n=1 Tax=Roseburia inulinivorans TaxID=360807 RepID=UPI000E4F0E71|nr:hypothetical protein [Roseburia inulinivorans]RGS69076.1 hypothetical protein DWX81_00650 [Roseburia inulinivorans]